MARQKKEMPVKISGDDARAGVSADDCSVTSAQGLAAGYLAQLQKGSKPSGAYVLR